MTHTPRRRRDVAESGQPPDDLGSAPDVECVDQYRDRQVVERSRSDIGIAQRVQQGAVVDRRHAPALEEHAEVIESKQVSTLQPKGVVGHRLRRHSGGGSRGHECTDARPGIERRRDAGLHERAQDTYVGEAFEPTTAENHGHPRAHC